MKKILALVLALALCLSAAVSLADPAPIAKEDIRVGVILLHDELSTYDLNFINSAKRAVEALGLGEDQLKLYRSIPESAECAEVAEEAIVDDGCNIVFFDSYGHQFYTDDVVEKYPDVQFYHATGDRAHLLPYSNLHNAFATIYEGRYLAGIAAGMKLNQLKEEGKLRGDVPLMGYVGAYTYAEVVSGYTSFYLGAKSVCPDVKMMVQFTGEWYHEKKEKDACEALIAAGADLISQHADSMGAPTACEDAGIPNVCYNISTKDACPDTYLIYSKIDWEPYFEYIITAAINGQTVETDWTGTMETGSVLIDDLNEAVAAPGTKEALEQAKADILAGKLHVFDTATEGFITVGGAPVGEDWKPADDGYTDESTPVVRDGYLHESEFRSAPYFDLRVDGITLLNEIY